MSKFTIEPEGLNYRIVNPQGEPVQGGLFKMKESAEAKLAELNAGLKREKVKTGDKRELGNKAIAAIKTEAPPAQAEPTTLNKEAFVKSRATTLGNSPTRDLLAGRKAGKGDDGVMRNALGLESTDEFRHISKVWQDKCEGWDKLRARAAGEDAAWSSVLVPRDSVQFYVSNDGDFSLVYGDNSREHKQLDEWGLRSLMEFTNIPWEAVKYLKPRYPEQLQRFVNDELAKFKDTDKEFFIRARGETVGYVASEVYSTLDLDEYFDLMDRAMKECGVDPSSVLSSHSVLRDGDCWGNLLFPDRFKSYPDSDWGIGMAHHNSMRGWSSAGGAPFAFRAICLNGCIWDRYDSALKVVRRHANDINRDEMVMMLKVSIQCALTEGHSFIELIQSLKGQTVRDPKDLVVAIAKQNKLGKKLTAAWAGAIGSDPGAYDERDAFTVYNALTFAAQGQSDEDRLAMERLAGKLAMPSIDAKLDDVLDYWRSLEAAAKRVTSKDREKYLAGVA